MQLVPLVQLGSEASWVVSETVLRVPSTECMGSVHHHPLLPGSMSAEPRLSQRVLRERSLLLGGGIVIVLGEGFHNIE